MLVEVLGIGGRSGSRSCGHRDPGFGARHPPASGTSGRHLRGLRYPRPVRHEMTAESAVRIVSALSAAGVRATVGGGWAVDAIVGRQTRPHDDLDLWLPAEDLERLLPVVADIGLDRLLPWGGDRPWVIVLRNGAGLRVDLHMYEVLPDGFLHYGSVVAGHRIASAS